MKIRVLVAVLMLSASATSAIAAGPYVGGSTGLTFFHESRFSDWSGRHADISYDPGFALNGFGGYRFDSGFRVEGEIGVRNAEMNKATIDDGRSGSFDDTNLSAVSFMANVLYDIKTGHRVNPFLGAGIGAIHGIVEEHDHDYSDTVFGYQLTAGITFPIVSRLDMDISYRFQGAASDFSINGTKTSYHSSSLLAGVRYNFGN